MMGMLNDIKVMKFSAKHIFTLARAGLLIIPLQNRCVWSSTAVEHVQRECEGKRESVSDRNALWYNVVESKYFFGTKTGHSFAAHIPQISPVSREGNTKGTSYLFSIFSRFFFGFNLGFNNPAHFYAILTAPP